VNLVCTIRVEVKNILSLGGYYYRYNMEIMHLRGWLYGFIGVQL
jgi:hypothetical protein